MGKSSASSLSAQFQLIFFSLLSEETVSCILYQYTLLVSFVSLGNMMISTPEALLNRSSNTFVMTVLFTLALYRVLLM